MANHKIKVISFDLDNTLWPVAPAIHHAEKQLRQWIERYAPQAAGYDRDTLLAIREEVIAEHPALLHKVSQLRQTVLERLMHRSGYTTDAPRLARQAFAAFLTARHAVDYFSDVKPCIESLSRYYTLGALSNGNADIQRLSLGQYFTFAVSAEGVGVSKPDPQVFIAALNVAQCTAHEMVHVGDHPEDDIVGALELGIRAVWINRENIAFPEQYPPPTAAITDLTQLAQVIAAL